VSFWMRRGAARSEARTRDAARAQRGRLNEYRKFSRPRLASEPPTYRFE
jgi:hypothetical protein